MPSPLTSPAQVRRLLSSMDLRPSKALGQNFLVDANILRIILDLADLTPHDRVLEIGPGLGVLTESLLAKSSSVVAIEKDRRLYQHLHQQWGSSPRLELIHADVMRADLASLCATGIDKVVANLPYSVGTRALIELVEQEAPPRTIVVTVQLDVAERMAGHAGGKTYGTVSVLVQTRYRVAVEKVIAPTCFFPAPQVQSAVVKLERIEPPPPSPRNRGHFRALVKHAFHHRRKQMVTVLRAAPTVLMGSKSEVVGFLSEAGIDPKARPGTLTPQEWSALSDIMAASR